MHFISPELYKPKEETGKRPDTVDQLLTGSVGGSWRETKAPLQWVVSWWCHGRYTPLCSRGTRLKAGTRKRYYLSRIHAFYKQPCSQIILPIPISGRAAWPLCPTQHVQGIQNSLNYLEKKPKALCSLTASKNKKCKARKTFCSQH